MEKKKKKWNNNGPTSANTAKRPQLAKSSVFRWGWSEDPHKCTSCKRWGLWGVRLTCRYPDAARQNGPLAIQKAIPVNEKYPQRERSCQSRTCDERRANGIAWTAGRRDDKLIQSDVCGTHDSDVRESRDASANPARSLPMQTVARPVRSRWAFFYGRGERWHGSERHGSERHVGGNVRRKEKKKGFPSWTPASVQIFTGFIPLKWVSYLGPRDVLLERGGLKTVQ